ncbi:MAG TPA: hypothetical protein [Caudoviricetes sp.]|nr:MAG TPA: hypothetical protein [Caudoviricetes sp.]
MSHSSTTENCSTWIKAPKIFLQLPTSQTFSLGQKHALSPLVRSGF